MTVKEFSVKYQIPYSIVYQATYNIKKLNDYEITYSETQLLIAVNNILTERINRITKQLKKTLGIKHKLSEVQTNGKN